MKKISVELSSNELWLIYRAIEDELREYRYCQNRSDLIEKIGDAFEILAKIEIEEIKANKNGPSYPGPQINNKIRQ